MTTNTGKNKTSVKSIKNFFVITFQNITDVTFGTKLKSIMTFHEILKLGIECILFNTFKVINSSVYVFF